jgi:GT2 family glycosyltransferase
VTSDEASGPSQNLNVIVVAYGSPALLHDALEPLRGAYPIIVVDNSSSPEVKDVAQAAEARYVDPEQNLGFARAVNVALGLRQPPDADVLLLNPDAQISAPDVGRMLRVLHAQRDVAGVAPAQHAAGSARPNPVWWPWHTPLGAWMEAIGLRRLRSTEGFVGGAILLVDGAALADVGLFDERYFMYSEEEDWQRRARQRGWRLSYCANVEALHRGGGTESNVGRLQLRVHVAIERYIRKWYGAAGWTIFRAGTIFGCALRVIVYRGHRRRTMAGLMRMYLEGPDKAGRRTGAIPATSIGGGAS